MKMLKYLAMAVTLLFLPGLQFDVLAEMVTVYGPVYIAKTKGHEHEKETKLHFTAPTPGAGIVVVKNGGDSGKKQRVSSAKIELNEDKLAGEKDFNKNVAELRFNVQLKAENELEVKIHSCKDCELEITVLGEPAVVTPPTPPGPTGPALPAGPAGPSGPGMP